LKFAIERHFGFEQEVEASDNLIRHFVYYCPECGENVHFVKSGGCKGAYFAHNKKTDVSPECDKRVDGIINLPLSERLGLSLYLLNENNKFSLALSFPALGELELIKAFNKNTKVNIGDNYSVKVSSANFFEDKSTLISVNFIPKYGKYKISYQNSYGLTRLLTTWPDYAEAFVKHGIIFSIKSNGCKRVKTGDSIVIGREYYYIIRDKSYSYYLNHKEINIEHVGNLNLKNECYEVFKLKVTLDKSLENRSRILQNIGDDLFNLFGVRLNEETSEILSLWPPVIQTDVCTPVFTSTKLFANVISSNPSPNVYYYRNGLGTPEKWVAKDKMITLPFLYGEVIFSVDRKYVGRESYFVKRNITPITYDNNIEFYNGDKLVENTNKLRLDSLKDSYIRCNSKMDLIAKSNNYTFRKIPIREDTYPINTFKYGDELIFVAEDNIAGHTVLCRDRQKTSLLLYESLLNELNKASYGVPVPVPGWVYKVVKKMVLIKEYDLANSIKNHIHNNKISYGVYVLLTKYKEELL
jgi:hypothetical protein